MRYVVLLISLLFVGCQSDINNQGNYDYVVNGCGFSGTIENEKIKIDSSIVNKSFEYIIDGIRKFTFISNEIIVKPINDRRIAIAYEISNKNIIGYDKESIGSFFDENPISRSINWANPTWSKEDKKYFPYLFIASHELAHIINDHNLFLVGCSDNKELRKLRELKADSTAGYIMQRLNVRPIIEVFKALQRFHNENDCYPTLEERIEYAKLGYMQAAQDFGLPTIDPFDDGKITPTEEIISHSYSFYEGSKTTSNMKNIIFAQYGGMGYLNRIFDEQILGSPYFKQKEVHTQIYGIPTSIKLLRTCFKELVFDTIKVTDIIWSDDWIMDAGKLKKRDIFNQTKFYSKEDKNLISIKHEDYIIDSLYIIIDSIFHKNQFNNRIVTAIPKDDNSVFALEEICEKFNGENQFEIMRIVTDVNGSSNYIDLGFTFSEEILQNWDKAQTTKLYSISNCYDKTNFVTTKPELYSSCSSQFIGYVLDGLY